MREPTPKQRLKPHRDDDYLDWLKVCNCCVCGVLPMHGCDPAHIRMGNGGGVGLKPSDYRAVPLCHKHHDEQHRIGEKTFWINSGTGEPIDTDKLIGIYLVKYLSNIGHSRLAVEVLEELAAEAASE